MPSRPRCQCGAGLTVFNLSPTTTAHWPSRYSRTYGRPAGVLYIDRGVIALNKPPGLVSQGTSSVAPVTAKSGRKDTSSRTAFDDVLDGTLRLLFRLPLLYCTVLGFVPCLSANAAAGGHLTVWFFFFGSSFRSPTGLWPQYKSVSSPSTRQGKVRRTILYRTQTQNAPLESSRVIVTHINLQYHRF